MLKKQIYVTDKVQRLDKDDLLLSLLEQLINNKVWHCKILLRTVLMVNKKSHSKYFKQTYKLVKSMLESGICQDLRADSTGPEMWHNVKMGLVMYIITAGQNPEEVHQMQQLFLTCISSEI